MDFYTFKNYINSVELFNENIYQNLVYSNSKKLIDKYFVDYINEVIKQNDYNKLLKIKYYIYNYIEDGKASGKKMSTSDANINEYLKEVDSYPVLSPIKEKLMFYELSILKKFIKDNNVTSNTLNNILSSYNIKFLKVNNLGNRKIQLANLKLANRKEISCQELEIFEKYIDYLEMKNSIINSNLRLVLYVILKTFIYVDSKLNVGDLIQAGNIGLIKAVESFKLSFGFKFSTYAIMKIKREIMCFLEKILDQVHVPQHLRRELKRIEKSMFNLENIGKGNLDIEELSSEFNISKDRLQDLLAASKELISFDDKVEEDSEITYGETIKDPNNEIDNYVYDDSINIMLNSVFRSVTYKEKLVLLLRYGILVKKYFTKEQLKIVLNTENEDIINTVYNSCEELTLEQIGEILNFSGEWIRIKEKKALNKIKNNKILMKKLVDNKSK